MKRVRVVIFAKAPIAGFAKTRLIPVLGPQGAASLARRMLAHTLAQALAADIGPVEVCVTPALRHPAWRTLRLPEGIVKTDQGAGNLGERLARAARRVTAGGQAVVLLGADCPQIGPGQLQMAARSLDAADAVMVPAADGGYVLLAMNRFDGSVFEGVTWSTGAVAAETGRRIGALGWSVVTLPTLHDIDEPDDLAWLPATWSRDECA